MRKKKTVFSMLTYFFLLLLVLLVVSLLVSFFENGQRIYYVQYGNKRISSAEDNCVLPQNGYSFFYCHSVAGIKPKYSVKVVPNVDNNSGFIFDVNGGGTREFRGETDLSAAFRIIEFDGYFTLFVDSGLTMEKVLASVYGGKSIVIHETENADITKRDCFALVISFPDEQVRINFRIQGGKK